MRWSPRLYEVLIVSFLVGMLIAAAALAIWGRS